MATQKCSSLFETQQFLDDFQSFCNSFFDYYANDNYLKYLTNKLNNFSQIFYKEFLKFCKTQNYNYTLNQENNLFIEKLKDILQNQVQEFPAKFNTFFKELDQIINNPEKITIIEEEENLSSSSFIYDTIGQGLVASEYIKEVKDTLFQKLIWDKENDHFITSAIELQDKIFQYYQELSLKALDENTFINLIQNKSLATKFESKFSKETEQDPEFFIKFKNRFTLTYIDNFIEKDFKEFIKIDSKFKNNFDNEDISKYSYFTEIKLRKDYDDSKFLDLEQNTEKLIKLFLENFMIYNGDVSTNITFTTSSWAEAINYMSLLKNIDFEITETVISNLKNLTENKSQQDYILLDDLKGKSRSYLFNAMNKNPHFYLKYYLQTLLYDQQSGKFTYNNLLNLAQQDRFTELTHNKSKNKFNLIYSVYKNLFNAKHSIQSSTWKSENSFSQNYLSAIVQNIMSTGTIEPVELKTEEGALMQRESKASYIYADRRNLETQINERNQSNQDPNAESFKEWCDAVNQKYGIQISLKIKNNKKEQDYSIESISSIENNDFYFQIADNKGTVLFNIHNDKLKNSKNSNYTINQLINISEPFGKLVDLLTGIHYNNSLYRDAFESKMDNIHDLNKICFDILSAQVHFRDGITFSELNFSQSFRQSYKSSITTNRLTELYKIAALVTAIKGTEKLNVYKDANGAQISSTNLGNLASTPMIYQSEGQVNPEKVPTSQFTILNPDANFSIKTIRGAQLGLNPYEEWKQVSLPDMFLGTFYTEFIGGFSTFDSNNYSTTNGKRIGGPCVVNADKTAFYQLFLNTAAELFNGQNILEASSEQIKIQYFNDLQRFYTILQNNLIEKYKSDCAILKQSPITEPKLQDIWNFYSTNKKLIEEFNTDPERTSAIIEVNDVFQDIKIQQQNLINTEIKKFSKYDTYNKHAEINDRLFAHRLLTEGIRIPFKETSEKGYLLKTLENLLGNDKYAYDLIEKLPKEAKKEDYWEVSNINSSFYPNKVYYVKKKNIDLKNYFNENINIEESKNITLYDSVSGKTYQIFPNNLYFLSNSNHKNPYLTPIAKISFWNKYGEYCSKILTQYSDLESVIYQMDPEKYPNRKDLLENPLALYSSKEIEFQLNPLLAKFNAFNTLISQEYIISQVGSNLAHKPKGAPTEEEFKEKNPWLVKNNKLTELGKIAYHEVLLGFMDRTQQKRNNNNTAQEKRLDTSIIKGLPNKFKVACVADIYSLGFSANGAEGEMKGMDGATYITNTCAKAINESLGAAKVSTETLKLFAALYDTELGIGSNNKTANFTLTNEKVRKDEMYQRMLFNMLKHRWRKQDENFYDPGDTLFKSDIDGTYLISLETPFYYKVNNKYYARIYTRYKNKKYLFDEYECDENGSLLTNKPTPIILTISDNFELYMALGGWNSCELINDKLQYSNWSQDKLYEIQVSKLDDLGKTINDNTLVDNTKMYKTNYYQPLLMSDIFMLLTEGAIKMTHTNLMKSDVLFENIQKPDGTFIESSYYNPYYQTADVLGPQLDKGHHADDSHLSNMTQVTSACISQGYTPKQALGVYRALGTLSRLATKTFRDENLTVLAPENMSVAIFTSLCDHLAKNFDQEENTLLGILAKGVLEDFKVKGYLTKDNLKELEENIPLDNTQIFKKIYSILGSTLTKNGIKLKVSGNLAVINPTDEIVKYYKIPVNHGELVEQYFGQLCVDYPEIPRAKLYNFLANFKGAFNIKKNYKDKINEADDQIQWKIVRSNQLPAIKLKNYPTTNTQSYIKNVLENLSEPVSIQDINIGLNYKITITGEAAINTFWDILRDPNLEKEDKEKQEKTIKELLEPAEFIDDKNNRNLVFWANVGLPYYELFKKKKHFIGQQIIKALSTVPDVKVEKLYSKGLDLEFQNVSFEDTEGNKFELTDLMTLQLYCQLSNNKDNETTLLTYTPLINSSNDKFKDYFKFYCQTELNYKEELSEEIENLSQRKPGEQVLYNFLRLDLTNWNNKDGNINKQVETLINSLTQAEIQQIKELESKEEKTDKEKVELEEFNSKLKKKQKNLKEAIQNTLIDICKRFHYKTHQDDLHALSKNSTLSDQITDVYVVSGYTGNTLHNQIYKKVKVNKDSIKNKVCGVIMPKTIKSVLGLDGDETVNEILADKNYFYKKLLTNANCRLQNIPVLDENTGEEKVYSTWDICLKRKNNQQIYIKTRQDNSYLTYLQDTDRYKKYNNDTDLDGNPIAYSNINNDQYKLFSPNDEVYYDSILDCIIIVADPAYIINKNNDKIPIKKGYEQKNLGQLIQENEVIELSSPYQFYIESIPHFVATLNTEPSVDFDFSQESLNWQLFDNAITKSDTNQFLVAEYDFNIKILNYLRNNNNEPYLIDEPELASLKRYYTHLGKLLHQSFDKILNIIAARIPAQCLQSVMCMRVADFIDSDTNNAMVSVYQFYLQGSDLDIDTVSLKTFTLNKQGIFQTHSPYYNLKFDEASTLLPFKPEIKEITINDEQGIAWETIENLMIEGRTETIDGPLYNSETRRFNLNSSKNIKALAKILDLFTEDMPYVKSGNNVNENIVKLLSKHYKYYHKLSKYDKECAAKNFETNNEYNVVIDTSHMSESTASIDNIVSPVKTKGNKSKQAQKDWYNTIGNSMSIPLGIRINMEGKDGIALCAVAEKHYFALIGAFQAVLESGDQKLKEMLLAGLPWLDQDKDGNTILIENPIYNGKVGNTIARVVSNAFDSRLIDSNFTFGDNSYKYLQLTTAEQYNIDETLKVLVEQQRYNPNAALVISAMLSLATDNAKELILGKINAGTEVIDLYLAGASIGLSFDTLETIINSNYGQEITKLRKNDYFSHKKALTTTVQAVQQFDLIDTYIKNQFKEDRVIGRNIIQPHEAVQQYLGQKLLEKYKELTGEDNIKDTIFNIHPIENFIEKIEEHFKDDKKKQQFNLDLQNQIKDYCKINEISLSSIKEKQKQELIATMQIWYNSYSNQIDNLNITTEVNSFLNNPLKQYDIPYKDRRRALYRDLKNIINYIRENYLINEISNGNTGSFAVNNKKKNNTNLERFFNIQKTKALVLTAQVWDMYLDRISACITKYSTPNIIDILKGAYDPIQAFNQITRIADEFSRGSRLLINKELKTQFEDVQTQINNFEEIFINQFKLNYSTEILDKLDITAWVQNIKNKDKIDFQFNYLTFNEEGLPNPDSGARLNLDSYCKDPKYKLNCLNLLNQIKTFFNILLPVSVLPHYQAYMESLLAQTNATQLLLQNIVYNKVTRPLIIQYKIRDKKIRNNMLKLQQALLESYSINSYLENNNFIIKIPKNFKGFDEFGNSKHFVNSEQISLKTNYGRLNFIALVHNLIPDWQLSAVDTKSALYNNQFIDKLIIKSNSYTLSGQAILPYSLDIDLNPTAEIDKRIYDTTIKHYLNLNQITDDHFIQRKNENLQALNLADIFYLYSLLTSGNQVSKVSLSRLVNNQLTKDGSLAQDYIKHQATENNLIQKSALQNIDPNSKNLNLSGNTLIANYIKLFNEDLKYFLIPIVQKSINDSQGTIFRQLDTNTNTIHLIEKSNSINQSNDIENIEAQEEIYGVEPGEDDSWFSTYKMPTGFQEAVSINKWEQLPLNTLYVPEIKLLKNYIKIDDEDPSQLIITIKNNKVEESEKIQNKLTDKTKNDYVNLIQKINPSLNSKTLEGILNKFIKAKITDGQVILYEFIDTKELDDSTLTGKCE